MTQHPRQSWTVFFSAILVLVMAGFASTGPARAGGQVPASDEIGDKIVNYQRRRPDLATGGLLKEGAVDILASAGVATVVDLRTPMEGTADERTRVRAAGMRYVNIPVGRGGPKRDQVGRFSYLLRDPANFPMIVHCGSGSRVGAIFTLLKLSQGTALEAAFAEGRSIGMRPGLEEKLRRRIPSASPRD